MLGPLDALPVSPRRVVIAGADAARTSGLAVRLARILSLARAHAGAQPTGDRWVAELTADGTAVAPEKADTLVVLDLSRKARDATLAVAARIAAAHPQLQVVRLQSRRQVEQFVFAAGTHRADALDG